MEVFIMILLIAGAGMTIAAVKSAGGNVDAVWKAASQRLGLRFAHGDLSNNPVISGTRRGLSIRIDTYQKSGESDKSFTRYRVKFPESLGLGLNITRRARTGSFARTRGTPNVATGDDDFDEVVLTKGHHPEEVIDFLTSVRRRHVARFLTLCPGTTIDDVSIVSETPDIERSPDRIVQLILRMTDLAEHLAFAEETEPDPAEESTNLDETGTDPHFIGLPYVPAPSPAYLEDMLEVESEPAEIFETPAPFDEGTESIDEEILSESGFHDHGEDISEESMTTVLSASKDEGLSIKNVVQTLFAPNQTTSDSTKLFESLFKGQEVVWTGTLLNLRTYRFDLVFGDKPGTRAEVQLLGAEHTGAAGRPVKAVVQGPVEEEDHLRSLVDRDVAMRGVLFSCDAFMKTLYVTDGQIDEVR